jgi:hypothetical protein
LIHHALSCHTPFSSIKQQARVHRARLMAALNELAAISSVKRNLPQSVAVALNTYWLQTRALPRIDCSNRLYFDVY